MSQFPSFPPCCQKILELLAREKRTGSRNCENGHSLQLDWARGVEAEAARKRAERPAAPKP